MNKTKKCKYCKSDIDVKATVCPKCSKDQRSGNNPLWLIPIILIIGFFSYCILSPNAPLKAREIVCGLSLRSGFPYCYYIHIDN